MTASAELVGQVALGRGLTSQFRPRTYFTIPKASLERLLDDVEQFINFFVIESQRIVYAENVYATIAVSWRPCRLLEMRLILPNRPSSPPSSPTS